MEKKIGKNVSSGAEKVESVTGKNKKAPGVQKSAAQAAREQAQAAEREAAQARFEAAKARSAKKEASRMQTAQAKQKKMQAKLEEKSKRLEARAARKSVRAEKKAAKAARREMIASESAAEKKARLAREKRERLAQKRQRSEARERAVREKQEARKKAQQKRAASRAKKREQKGSGKRRAPGIGGWIAAVSVLGAACLALAAVVTVGSFRMSDMAMRSANGYRATLYELVSVSEDMDDNFAKLRVSSGTGEQRTLLTQILVDAALMESAIEKIPVDAATGTDISSFVNRTGMSARRMLAGLSAGGTLDEREQKLIAYLYETNAKLCSELTLQLFDLKGNRRLGKAQLLSCPCEAVQLRHMNKCHQIFVTVLVYSFPPQRISTTYLPGAHPPISIDAGENAPTTDVFSYIVAPEDDVTLI